MKPEKYLEKWQGLIHSIKEEEGEKFIVINPETKGRITIVGKA